MRSWPGLAKNSSGAPSSMISRTKSKSVWLADGTDVFAMMERLTGREYGRTRPERTAAVLKSIDEQGKLTPELRAAIDALAAECRASGFTLAPRLFREAPELFRKLNEDYLPRAGAWMFAN